ncbi:hypothetical protein OROGR_023981 [Orobanche gracilis]
MLTISFRVTRPNPHRRSKLCRNFMSERSLWRIESQGS